MVAKLAAAHHRHMPAFKVVCKTFWIADPAKRKKWARANFAQAGNFSAFGRVLFAGAKPEQLRLRIESPVFIGIPGFDWRPRKLTRYDEQVRARAGAHRFSQAASRQK